MPDRPSPRTPDSAPWGDSPSAHPTRRDFFLALALPRRSPVCMSLLGRVMAHAEWCVCLLNQQAHQGALITGVRAGHRSRGTCRKEPTRVRAGLAADWRPQRRGSPTNIEIYHNRKFPTAVEQRFKLLSLFFKVAGSIPGVVKKSCDSCFFGGACGGRRDKPNQHGARTDASPLGVFPCGSVCGALFVGVTAMHRARPPTRPCF